MRRAETRAWWQMFIYDWIFIDVISLERYLSVEIERPYDNDDRPALYGNTIIQSGSEWFLINANSVMFFSAISCRGQVNFQWDNDDVRLVLDQHASLHFFTKHGIF
jgi:hypothetical protein